jgi:hypothetical protein
MSELRQEKNTTDKIEDASDYHKCSDRRFRDHIRAGEVLGVTLISGHTIFANQSSASYIPQGPIADIPSTYILPKALEGVLVQPISGLVNGPVYVCNLIKRSHHLSEIELVADQGHSGVCVRLISIVKGDPQVST